MMNFADEVVATPTAAIHRPISMTTREAVLIPAPAAAIDAAGDADAAKGGRVEQVRKAQRYPPPHRNLISMDVDREIAPVCLSLVALPLLR